VLPGQQQADDPEQKLQLPAPGDRRGNAADDRADGVRGPGPVMALRAPYLQPAGVCQHLALADAVPGYVRGDERAASRLALVRCHRQVDHLVVAAVDQVRLAAQPGRPLLPAPSPSRRASLAATSA